MTEIRCVAAAIFIIGGLFFMTAAVIGVLRFPDFFSRLHSIGLGQSLGLSLCCIGLFIYQGVNITGGKILLVMIFSLAAGPVGTHIVDKVAFRESFRKAQADKQENEKEEKEGRAG